MRQQNEIKLQSTIKFVAGLVVTLLYGASQICVGIGLGVLIVILLFGRIDIENGRLLALGILMFIPLRYIKNRIKNA